MVAAISSISAIQRQPLAVADSAARADRSSRSGWEMDHSDSRVSSTPSARARARAASSRAAVPLVQDAYAIFTADAVTTTLPTPIAPAAAVPAAAVPAAAPV